MRSGNHPGFRIEFHKLMAIAGKDKRNVVQPPGAVILRLLQPMLRRQPFALGLQNGQRQRLPVHHQRTPQHIIRPPLQTPPGFFRHWIEVHRPRHFLLTDVLTVPAPEDEGRVNEFLTGLSLAAGHRLLSNMGA